MIKKLFIGVVLIFLTTLIITSCVKDLGKPEGTSSSAKIIPANICDSATYNFKIKAIVDTKCAIGGCHAAGSQAGGVLLTDYSSVKSKADGGRIKVRVIDKNTVMPPASNTQLTTNELALVQCWLDKGAPQ